MQDHDDGSFVRTHASDADDIRQTVADLARHLAEHPRAFGDRAPDILAEAGRLLADAADAVESVGPTFTYCDHPLRSDPAAMPRYGQPDGRRQAGPRLPMTSHVQPPAADLSRLLIHAGTEPGS